MGYFLFRHFSTNYKRCSYAINVIPTQVGIHHFVIPTPVTPAKAGAESINRNELIACFEAVFGYWIMDPGFRRDDDKSFRRDDEAFAVDDDKSLRRGRRQKRSPWTT